MSETFDYIVVGGGSAGCIVAAELSRDPKLRVLLVECGDAAESNPETLVADGYKDAFTNERLMFDRFSDPQANGGNRRWFLGSGRGLGGSGAINAMVYTRGSKEDYAEWPEGWRWDQLAPHFEELEQRLRPHRREPTEFTRFAIRAAVEAGFREKTDLNDGDLSGVLGYEWMNYEADARRSSYVSFLRGRELPNLVTIAEASVERLLIEDKGQGRRVVGVELRRGEVRSSARATREVVLCAGALETPRLLMLSGIGPSDVLRRAGLPVLCDSPNVGKNLHDHPNVQLFFFGKKTVDCNYPQLYGFHRVGEGSQLKDGQSDTCYVFYPARSSFREGVIKLLPSIALPEWAYRRQPLVRAMRSGISSLFASGVTKKLVNQVWGIVVILGKPVSRGSLRVVSSRPDQPASIDPGYFTAEEDMTTMLRGVELARKIAGTPESKRWGAAEVMPGKRVAKDEDVRTFIEKNAMTTYHYAGTCKMSDGSDGVVDSRLRLQGIAGLRVADASVIPTTPVSALNAPSMLIGLRASQLIREELSV